MKLTIYGSNFVLLNSKNVHISHFSTYCTFLKKSGNFCLCLFFGGVNTSWLVILIFIDFTIHRFLNMILDSIFLSMTSGVKDTWWYRSLFKQDGRWFGMIDWCTWNCSLPNLVLHAFCANPDFEARKRSEIESCLHTWIDTALQCARFNKLTSVFNASVLLLIMISS